MLLYSISLDLGKSDWCMWGDRSAHPRTHRVSHPSAPEWVLPHAPSPEVDGFGSTILGSSSRGLKVSIPPLIYIVNLKTRSETDSLCGYSMSLSSAMKPRLRWSFPWHPTVQPFCSKFHRHHFSIKTWISDLFWISQLPQSYSITFFPHIIIQKHDWHCW